MSVSMDEEDVELTATAQLYAGEEREAILASLTEEEPHIVERRKIEEEDEEEYEEAEDREQETEQQSSSIIGSGVGLIGDDLHEQGLVDFSHDENDQETKLILAAAADSEEQQSMENQQGYADAAATLQGLLSSGQLVDGQPIQIIALSGGGDGDMGGKLWQVVSTGADGMEAASFVICNGSLGPEHLQGAGIGSEVVTDGAGVLMDHENNEGSLERSVILPPLAHKALPQGCPEWAARLRDCEQIGDFYRGWVDSEVELDVLLTYHKQHTQSTWGTRQSPSLGKPSQRLMWKSQYVPFDGVPFVNTGSRAVVMECQFGPRRKGITMKKPRYVDTQTEAQNNYKQTCPARIYIKRVKKFPTYRVDLTADKKTQKLNMEKAFNALKEIDVNNQNIGQDRWYVQLPTDKAHEFHSGEVSVSAVTIATSTASGAVGSIEKIITSCATPTPSSSSNSRLNLAVLSKIRSLVAAGETRLYRIRKTLRRYVEKELFPDYSPEKHNLRFYPTVNDLQNHIHQAIKDIESGKLPITARTVNVEMIANSDIGVSDQMWPVTSDRTHPETVTVTLTQKPGDESQRIITRVETRMSNGTTKVSSGVTPETAKMLTRFNPNMFPPESLIEQQSGDGFIAGLDCHAGTLTLLQQPTDNAQAGGTSDSGGDDTLNTTPEGGVILPSGDIHQGQNGIYTVISSDHHAPGGGQGLMLSNGGQLNVGRGASVTVDTEDSTEQEQDHSDVIGTSMSDTHHTDTLTFVHNNNGQDEADLGIITEAGLVAGGMVVHEMEGGGLMLMDAHGNTMKLEQMGSAEDEASGTVDEATGEIQPSTGSHNDHGVWTLQGSNVVKYEPSDDGFE